MTGSKSLSPSTKLWAPLSITVSLARATASLVGVIAQANGISKATLLRDAVLATVHNPAPPMSNEEYRASLVAALTGTSPEQRRAAGERPKYSERLSTVLDAGTHQMLVKYCQSQRLSKSAAVRRAVETYVSEELKRQGVNFVPGFDVGLVDTGVGRRPPADA